MNKYISSDAPSIFIILNSKSDKMNSETVSVFSYNGTHLIYFQTYKKPIVISKEKRKMFLMIETVLIRK